MRRRPGFRNIYVAALKGQGNMAIITINVVFRTNWFCYWRGNCKTHGSAGAGDHAGKKRNNHLSQPDIPYFLCSFISPCPSKQLLPAWSPALPEVLQLLLKTTLLPCPFRAAVFIFRNPGRRRKRLALGCYAPGFQPGKCINSSGAINRDPASYDTRRDLCQS